MTGLNHILWQKLVIPAASRKKGHYIPPPLPVRNRQQHSAALTAGITSVIGSTQAQRVSMGLDPSHMLAIEFTARLDSEVRSIIEGNLGLNILSEVVIERDLPIPLYSVEVHAPNAFKKGRLVARLDQAKLRIEEIEPVRSSDGEEDERKARFVFSTPLAAKYFKLHLEREQEWSGFKVFDPVKKQRETFYKTIVQFPDAASIEHLQRELASYRNNGARLMLTPIQRATLFDALEYVRAISPEDRLGVNARAAGFPAGEFYFDLDLWHTGDDPEQEKTNAKIAVEHSGGEVTDIKAVADMLILVRVLGSESTARKLLEYDRVSRLDLPPRLPQQVFDVLTQRVAPPRPKFGENMPRACVVDSGIIPSHPLISGGVIDSRDFNSGDNTAVDTTGHGTHVAGIVVYGNIVHALTQNQWVPKVQVVNAKVLGKGKIGLTEFSDIKRAETQLEEAIRWAFKAHKCRVFNLSLGNPTCTYTHGHQLPWALTLDTLARELDIVIVVSSGNNTSPVVPSATSREQLRLGVLDNIYGPDHALIDPATAAMVLTVGSVARIDQPSITTLTRYPGDVEAPVASASECPSVFTRTGICDGRGGGLHRSIKPELVAYGGNQLLKLVAPPYEWGNDQHLGEPSLAFDYQSHNKLFASACGTSFAAPFVTHIAARIEHMFKNLGSPASLNLIRALIVNSAKHSQIATSFIEKHRPNDAELSILRAMGYGKPDPDAALYSAENRVVLYVEEEVAEDGYDLYELVLPEAFVRGSGRRRIHLTLAYDPPVRGARKEYLARTMWFELFRDVSAREIQMHQAGKLAHPLSSESLSPKLSRLEWSTVQSAYFEARNSTKLAVNGSPRVFHVLVGCQKRFPSGEEAFQRYALVATLEHEKDDVHFYNNVKAQIQVNRLQNKPRVRV